MRILLLTFYYPPDLCAGSFRAGPMVEAIQNKMNPEDELDVVTTVPNRYLSYKIDEQVSEHSQQGNTHIYRVPQIQNKIGGFVRLATLYVSFFFRARSYCSGKDYDLVIATSSRLMTAFLGATIANKKKAKLYLDIRDLFVDTIQYTDSGALLKLMTPMLKVIERYTFKSAAKINSVSEGFNQYLLKFTTTAISTYTNGVDEEFLTFDWQSKNLKSELPFQITYAGNIGEGQGLEKLIPELAKKLGSKVQFNVIGDGGTKHLLEAAVTGIENVTLQAPMSRAKLLPQLDNADALLVHLNDLPAFEKVLPSKLFEYAAIPKPIVAGLSGYAKQFIEQNISDSYCYNNILEAELMINSLIDNHQQGSIKNIDRTDFIQQYRRQDLMNELANDILSIST